MILWFKEWFLNESVGEQQALQMLQGDTQLLQQFKDPSLTKKYLPVMVYFFLHDHANLDEINNVFISYNKLENKVKPIQWSKKGIFYGNQLVNWLEFSEQIHAIEQATEGKKKYQASILPDKINDPPIFNKNSI